MSKILTVAKHVFRESLRKKILFILVLFFLVLLVSSFFLEAVSQEDKIKLVERISFGSLAFFGVMAAIFLSATSLPGEIEEKLIQVVVTKPITRFNFLLGKMLGFTSVIFLLFLLMGTLSWALIQVTAKGNSLHTKKWLSPQSLTFAGGDEKITKRLEEALNKGGNSWLVGPQDIRAIWTWKGLKGNLPQGEVAFQVINTTPGGGPRRTELEIKCSSPQESGKVQKIVVEDNKPAKFEINLEELKSEDATSSPGELQVEVRRLNRDYAIGIRKESLKVLLPPGSFHLNFLKALLLLFFELTLMVIITVMGSTFLSSAVTIILSLFVYLIGHMIDFLKTMLRTIEAVGSMALPHNKNAMEAGEHGRQWFMEVFKLFFSWFAKLFPNLRRFEVSSSIINGIDIPSSLIRDGFIYMLIYASIAFLIAHLFFRRKEFR